MVFLYIASAVAALVLLYLLAITPALKQNKTLKKLGVTRFAHRGLHGDGIPENSLSAFLNAVKAGVGIELDVQLTSDDVPVIMHDGNTKRTTNEEHKISKITAKKFASLKLANGEAPPTLKSALKVIDGKVPLLIELKPDGMRYKKLCKETFSLLKGYSGTFIAESFDPRVLLWLRIHRPKIARGQLAANELPMPRPIVFLLKNLVFNFLAKPHFVAYEHGYIDKNIAPRIMKKLFKETMLAWTVTDEKTDSELTEHGITTIFENYLPPKTGG